MTHSQQKVPPSKDQSTDAGEVFAPSDVLLFVDDTTVTESSIRHAQKVASAFGGEVVLVQVLCKPGDGSGPIDPVDWDIRKRQTLNRLGFLIKGTQDARRACSIKLLEGQCISQITAFMVPRQGDIAAVPRSRGGMGWHLSETAWGVLLSRNAAILMIPDDAKIEPDTRYRRILLPLDGSSRAETALQRAIVLARAETAELMLCYVIPEPGLSEFGPKDQEVERLHKTVRKQNEQAGKAYLARIKKRLEHNGLKISVKISDGGDARRALIDVMLQENIDFMVMATHGQSGHKDVPTGDVARFILDNANIPVLLVRPPNGHDNTHTFGKVSSTGGRQPVGTD